jgi:hypothetical protein
MMTGVNRYVAQRWIRRCQTNAGPPDTLHSPMPLTIKLASSTIITMLAMR